MTSSVGSAATLNYHCFSVDDNEPYGIEDLAISVIDAETLKIGLDVLEDVVETYKINLSYVGKSEQMKNSKAFRVVDPNSRAYSEGPVSPLFVELQPLASGFPLRRGGQGAFIKTSGHGYSYANYFCVLQD